MGQKPAEKVTNEFSISIYPNKIDPEEIQVRSGQRIVWRNETNKDCYVVFSNPVCPFVGPCHECKYRIPPNKASEPYAVSGKLIHEENLKVLFQYEIHFHGRRHRGTPRIIVTG